MPGGAVCFVHASVNGADFRLIVFRGDLCNNLLAERGNLLFGFGHQPRESSSDAGAMRDARKAERETQALILLQQFAQLAVFEGASRDGDNSQ